jgi:hypothetical protein
MNVEGILEVRIEEQRLEKQTSMDARDAAAKNDMLQYKSATPPSKIQCRLSRAVTYESYET